jgi:ABC-2 type transport system permease protein
LPSALVQVRALLTANRQSVWNALWNRGRTRRLGSLVGIALGAVLWILAIGVLGHFVAGPLAAPSGPLLTTVTGVLVLLTGFTLVTSVSFAVASAYFARDIEWLLTAPISSRVVLGHRLASQLILGVAVGGVLLGPILIAAGIRTGTVWLLPLAALALVSLLAVPVALGLLLVVLAVRVVPASRVRDAIAATASLVGFSMAALDIAGRAPARGLPWAGAVNALGVGWFHSAWFPPIWAARALTSAWRGDLAGAALWMLPLVGLAALALVAALRLAGLVYREGWARAQIAPRRLRRPVQSWHRASPALAVLRKDWRSLRRDPVQLSQLVLPLALFAIYLLAPHSADNSDALFQNFPLWYGPLATSAFAALFVASGLGLRAVGAEGQHFWCLRSAPVGLRELLLGKLALPFIVAVGASLVLMWAAELRTRLAFGEVAFSTALLVLCVGGLAALATGLGAMWPRLDWADPRRATGIWLSVVFLAAGSAYIGACMVALTLPLVIPSLGQLGSELGSMLACALCSGIVAVGALGLGYLRLRRLEL